MVEDSKKNDIVISEQKPQKDNWLTLEEKQIVMTQFFPPNATQADMVYCMNVAKTFNLNPILKQIFFVSRRTKNEETGQWITKIEPLAGRDSFLTLAHRTKMFDGIESHIEVKEIPSLENGEWVMKKELVAIANVWRKDTQRPFSVEVSYSEYVQKTSNGEVTKFWKDKPHTMLKKVAESQALRKAFNITGLYDESELDNEAEKRKNTTNAKENLDEKLEIPYATKNNVPQKQVVEEEYIEHDDIVVESITGEENE